MSTSIYYNADKQRHRQMLKFIYQVKQLLCKLMV